MPLADSGPLVGRGTELDAVLALTGASRSAHAALVSGDAGVGKTRLLRELVDRARSNDDLVMIGHCVNFGGDSVPYLPLSEAFGRLAREEPELAERLRAHYPPIERLLPQRRIIGAPSTISAPLEWSDLFEAIWATLATIGEQHPVLLVIEDAHWADSGTRDLIGFLLNRMTNEPVTLVVSYRSDDLHRRHPLRPAALEWARIPGVARIALGPLDETAMRALVSLRTARPLEERAIRTVLDRAGGNAFFAEQLVAEIDGSDQASGDLAELLLMRLDRLAPAARTVVRVAAVSGRQVSHALIAAVAGLSDDELDAALREAVESHVLDRSSGDRFAFHHALLAEAVYDDLLPGERIRWHRAFAVALTAGTVRGTDADLARHAREAMDLDTAFAATVRAGEEAMRVAAPNEAMRHYEAATAMVDQVEQPVLNLAELSLRAAEAASAAGHSYRAVELVRDARDQLPITADPLLRVELLLAYTTYSLMIDSGGDFFAASLEALQLVPDQPTALRARTLAAHAHASSAVYRDDDAVRLGTQARDLAEQLGLPEIAAEATTTLAKLRERSENPGDAAQLMEFSIEQATESGNLGAKLRSQFHLGGLYYDTGNLPLAAQKLQIAMKTANDGGRPWAVYGFDARVALSQAKYVMGEWDDALALCEVSAGAAPPLAVVGLAATAMLVHGGRGELGPLAELADQRPWWRRDGLIAILSAAPYMDSLTERGESNAALDLHDEVVDLVGRLWQNTWFQARIRLHSLALAALTTAAVTAGAARRPALVERGRVLIAAVETTVEQGLIRRPIQGPEGRAWCRRAHAEWARLRWAAGIDAPSQTELVDAWRSAAAAFEYGHVFERARSQVRLAAALQANGDSAAAQPIADEARETARRLRAEPLLEELRALALRPSRGSRAAETADGAVLTPRENQVLALLTDGRTNRQIARSLYISEKTVSVHVSNILAKLGASGRTEAAAIARRDGLLAG